MRFVRVVSSPAAAEWLIARNRYDTRDETDSIYLPTREASRAVKSLGYKAGTAPLLVEMIIG
jgi:hypothetical protein